MGNGSFRGLAPPMAISLHVAPCGSLSNAVGNVVQGLLQEWEMANIASPHPLQHKDSIKMVRTVWQLCLSPSSLLSISHPPSVLFPGVNSSLL